MVAFKCRQLASGAPIHTGDVVLCPKCMVALSSLSSLTPRPEGMLWTCEFCSTETRACALSCLCVFGLFFGGFCFALLIVSIMGLDRTSLSLLALVACSPVRTALDLVPEEVPKQDTVDYIIKPAPTVVVRVGVHVVFFPPCLAWPLSRGSYAMLSLSFAGRSGRGEHCVCHRHQRQHVRIHARRGQRGLARCRTARPRGERSVRQTAVCLCCLLACLLISSMSRSLQSNRL